MSDQSSQFEKDLEFIQLLCNPDYIRWLFNKNYFANKAFVGYLNYLKYFKDKKYKLFLLYPQSIKILDILCEENIEEKLIKEEFYNELKETQILLWRNRMTN
ncbi:MED31 [Hepatospora eriocheir]|uniref:Mediator of RNA polymerase II transcription subunit 31 n=1 Tax=Hepatospora eriocheir TaxID=1081669 RepID=A0A1X0QII0_9MICR|nr:MED31 [Hepatospora eriocheir]